MSNQDYVLFVDATADVAFEAITNGGLNFVHMECEADGKIFECTGTDSDEKLKQFYQDIRTGSLPKTSQITPYKYEEAFTPTLEGGKSILYLCFSSGMSKTYEAATLAASELNAKYTDVKVVPVDSIQATSGMSVLAELMINNKANGMSIDENAASLEEYKHKIFTMAYVENLHHLKRGGRISAASAIIGSAFNIKPMIKITPEGKLENKAKCRGARKAIAYQAEMYKTYGNMDSKLPVYVTDADNKEMADLLEEEIKKINPDALVRRRMHTPIVGSHLGPESVVIGFEEK